MAKKIKEAIMASFIADALALGVHWVYDTGAIKGKYGRLDKMIDPELAPYHKNRKKGEFTHYGDQMMCLLKSLDSHSGFDPAGFAADWQELFESYDGYMDQATKQTLDNFKTGQTVSGSMSSDLGGAARIAPLALFYGDDKEAFIKAAVAQTAMTHNQPAVISTARFFAAVAVNVLQGDTPIAALEKNLAQIDNQDVSTMVSDGLASKGEDTRKTISQFGQMCSVSGALQSCVHLIATYENDLETALIENIMAGGDSSARGMLAGFIIGAHQGVDNLPDAWTNEMSAHQKILDLMN